MQRASDIEGRSDRRQKAILWAAMIAGTICAGTAFCYKVAEFIFTISSDDVKGFADVPVTVYFAVAAGWLCLLVWCYVTGKFKDVESSKYDMLRQEEEYERLGE